MLTAIFCWAVDPIAFAEDVNVSVVLTSGTRVTVVLPRDAAFLSDAVLMANAIRVEGTASLRLSRKKTDQSWTFELRDYVEGNVEVALSEGDEVFFNMCTAHGDFLDKRQARALEKSLRELRERRMNGECTIVGLSNPVPTPQPDPD